MSTILWIGCYGPVYWATSRRGFLAATCCVDMLNFVFVKPMSAFYLYVSTMLRRLRDYASKSPLLFIKYCAIITKCIGEHFLYLTISNAVSCRY